jgi:dolichol-phosphate mannosyltransferase
MDTSTARPLPGAAGAVVLSVVIPVFDERDNVAALLTEVHQSLDGLLEYEIVVVNDGSRDGTGAYLDELAAKDARLRPLHHPKNLGQSAAIVSGVHRSRARWVATLDGDGQNDPADLPKLLTVLQSAIASGDKMLLVAGHRRERHDNWLRRFSSQVANGVRGSLLGDRCPDTGCGLKLFPRAAFLELPRFDHMHRFLPALFQRGGARLFNVAVTHRPRMRGHSKYGVWNRLWVGLVDLIGVLWLLRRSRGAKILDDAEWQSASKPR